MGRSYKRPWSTDKSQWHRKNAARRFRRRIRDVADGCAYKRYYPMWDIIDHRWQVYPEDPWPLARWRGQSHYDHWYRHTYRKHCGNRRAHRPRVRK